MSQEITRDLIAAIETDWTSMPRMERDARWGDRMQYVAARLTEHVADDSEPWGQSVWFHPQYGPMAEQSDLMSDACPMCAPAAAQHGRCTHHDWRMLRTEVVRLRALLTWLDASDRVETERHLRRLGKAYGRASATIGELRGVVARLRAERAS